MTSKPQSNKALRGRPVEHRFGDTIAIINTLATPGALVSPESLSALLDVDMAFVANVLDDLANNYTEENSPLLPLCPSGFGAEQMRVAHATPFDSKALRLTPSQAQACTEALEQLGFDVTHPLYQKIKEEFFPRGYLKNDNQASVEDESETSCTEALILCATAIAKTKRISNDITLVNDGIPRVEAPELWFKYRGKNDSFSRSRIVVPLRITYDQNEWQMDAHDLDEGKTKTFSIARLEQPELKKETKIIPLVSSECQEDEVIHLTCKKEVTAQVLTWPHAKLISTIGTDAIIEVPYYRGDWLPRRILSLGKSVSYKNPKLKKEVRDVAKDLLKLSKKVAVHLN